MRWRQADIAAYVGGQSVIEPRVAMRMDGVPDDNAQDAPQPRIADDVSQNRLQIGRRDLRVTSSHVFCDPPIGGLLQGWVG